MNSIVTRYTIGIFIRPGGYISILLPSMHEGRECTYGTAAIREEMSATQRGSFVSGIFNIGGRAPYATKRASGSRENINFYAKRRV